MGILQLLESLDYLGSQFVLGTSELCGSQNVSLSLFFSFFFGTIDSVVINCTIFLELLALQSTSNLMSNLHCLRHGYVTAGIF